MRRILILSLGLSWLTLTAYNQTNDYSDHFLVTTEGDTIYGLLKYFSKTNGMHDEITVKVSDTLKLTFNADEIVYFEEGRNEYVSFMPEGQNQHFFIRIWSVGYYELFEWEVPASMSKNPNRIEYRPLLRRAGEENFISLDHGKWKKQLAELLGDYKELADDVKKGKYPMDEMGHVIDRYNEWKEDILEGW